MKTSSRILAGVFALSLTSLCWAQNNAQRPDHFKGKAAATLEQAVINFSEYNNKLATLLAKPKLSPQDMSEVHQLTYTLENALEKIRADVAGLANTLEEVHKASETTDTAKVKQQGNIYLVSARKLVK